MRAPAAVTSRPALLGESPVWDERHQSLLWVDILRGEVHRLNPEDGDPEDGDPEDGDPEDGDPEDGDPEDGDRDDGDEVIVRMDLPVGAVAPRSRGGLVVAAGMGLWLVDGDRCTEVARADDRGERMNDGKCDPAGRWWAGTMTADRRPGAALYCLDTEHNLRTVLESVALSNGLGWSPDGSTMYYIDTPGRRVDAFRFEIDTGAIGDRRCFVDLDDHDGNPDGLTVDAEGGVWVAMARGGAIRRYDPHGRPDIVVPLPVQRVTSCTFGGPDLADLYITSASDGLSAEELAAQPLAGLVFCCRPGVRGLPAATYRG